jgi:hypothetical protein
MPSEPDRLGCAAVRESLQRRLDRELLTEMADVVAHRANCPACASWEAAAQRLEEGLRQSRFPDPPPDLADRILAELKAQPVRKRRRIGLIAAGMALAASVMIGIYAIGFWKTPDSRTVAVVIQQPQPQAPVDEPKGREPEMAAGLDLSLDEANAAVASLTRKAADETFSLRLPSLTLPDMTPSVEALEELEPAAASINEVRNGAVFGIAPIANSARRAADMFWREVAPDSERKPAVQ